MDGKTILGAAGTVILLLLSLVLGMVKWEASTLMANVLNHDERIRALELKEAVCHHEP